MFYEFSTKYHKKSSHNWKSATFLTANFPRQLQGDLIAMRPAVYRVNCVRTSFYCSHRENLLKMFSFVIKLHLPQHSKQR